MVDARFELTTNDSWSVDDAICEGISPLGYWQKVNQSSTQSLITLSLPLNNGILGLRMGPQVPTPKFFIFSGYPVRVIYQILDMRKFTFH